jgi:small subunit ribosomal protein S6e
MTLGNNKMVFKINLSHKGKTFKVETENESIVGTSIGDKVEGKLFSEDLEGYEIEITGTSDKAGFTGMPNIDGPGLHKVLLSYGLGMHKKPKGEKKVNKRPKGLRLRKTVRGKEISLETVQINSKVIKEGSKKFDSLFEKPAEEAPAEEKE